MYKAVRGLTIKLACLTFAGVSAQAQILSAVVASAPTAANWTFIQSNYNDDHGSNCAVSGTTCQIAVSAVGAGHTLIIFSEAQNGTGDSSLSSITEESSAAHCAACQNYLSAVPASQDMMYVTAATGGETVITCNFALGGAGYQGCGVIELACSGCTVLLDQGYVASVTCGPSCTAIAPTGLTGSNDVIVQTLFPFGDQANSISSPYTAVCSGTGLGSGHCSTMGAAYLLNTASTTAPVWTLGSNQAVAMNAIALRPASSGPPGTITLLSHVSASCPTGCPAPGTYTTSTIDTTGAKMIVIGMASYDGDVPTDICNTTTPCNTWTPLMLYSNTNGDQAVQLYYCSPCTTSTLHAFIGNRSGFPQYSSLAAAAFTMTAASFSLDAQNGTNLTDGTMTCAAGSISPAGSGELLVAAIQTTFNSSISYTIDSSFSITDQVPSSSGNRYGVGLAWFQYVSGSPNPTWTTDINPTHCTIAAFQ